MPSSLLHISFSSHWYSLISLIIKFIIKKRKKFKIQYLKRNTLMEKRSLQIILALKYHINPNKNIYFIPFVMISQMSMPFSTRCWETTWFGTKWLPVIGRTRQHQNGAKKKTFKLQRQSTIQADKPWLATPQQHITYPRGINQTLGWKVHNNFKLKMTICSTLGSDENQKKHKPIRKGGR